MRRSFQAVIRWIRAKTSSRVAGSWLELRHLAPRTSSSRSLPRGGIQDVLDQAQHQDRPLDSVIREPHDMSRPALSAHRRSAGALARTLEGDQCDVVLLRPVESDDELELPEAEGKRLVETGVLEEAAKRSKRRSRK